MIEQLEKRMDTIESKLDTIATNHLKHIERYTLWTLAGIAVSVAVGLLAVYISISGA